MWTTLDPCHTGQAKPDQWHSKPCVTTSSGGLSFNSVFSDVFGLTAGSRVQIMVNDTTLQIGIKILSPDSQSLPAFTVKPNGKKANSLYIGSKRISDFVKSLDIVGKTFLASMNAELRVIVINLDSAL